jgi:hypothetical protein
MAALDWQKLTELAGSSPLEIERIRLIDKDIAIEGRFSLPPLSGLSGEDQIFVAAFVRCHGSIKQMEKYFGVSYPTIKNRLNKLAAQLPFVEVEPADSPERPTTADLLTRLERGEVSVRHVLDELNAPRGKE